MSGLIPYVEKWVLQWDCHWLGVTQKCDFWSGFVLDWLVFRRERMTLIGCKIEQFWSWWLLVSTATDQWIFTMCLNFHWTLIFTNVVNFHWKIKFHLWKSDSQFCILITLFILFSFLNGFFNHLLGTWQCYNVHDSRQQASNGKKQTRTTNLY